jgi:GWxTD domain-containing protein
MGAMPRQVLLALAVAAILAPGAPAGAQRGGRKGEEKSSRYSEWLDKDVVYIITDEEKSVFKKLTTVEERDAFIEQFWARRDPTPRTPDNEFKEEHYRRIAYANENFKSGIEGWETDRGRIYITFGPPTNKETYASGSLYERRPEEGGATTSTWAFERWYYREIPGVGGGIELEFVDPTQTGEYRLAMRPSEKDALWNTGGGKTTAEIHGWATRLGVMRSDDMMRPIGLEGDPSYMAGAQPFARLQQYFQVLRPPELKFKDLRDKVETRISYNMLTCDLGVEIFRVAKDAVLVPATVRVPSAELTYKDFAPGLMRATISLYGKVETLTRTTVYEFEDSVSSDVKDQELAAGLSGVTVYQKQIPLRPGNYKLTVVVKDVGSEKLSTLTAGIQVPSSPEADPSTSSIVLADAIVSSNPGEDVTNPFIVPTGFKIYPNLKHEFDSRAVLYVYAEAYNTQLDQLSLQPRVRARLELIVDGKVVQSWVPRAIFLRGRLAIFHAIDLQKFDPRAYTLRLALEDTLSGRQFDKSSSFRVKRVAAKAS